MRAAQIVRYGEPVEFEIVETKDPELAGDEVLVDVEAVGVNFHDLNVAANAYGQNVALPHVLGSEVIGRLADGTRVAALTTEGGGFAERVAVSREVVFPLPEGVGDLEALTMVIQGNTAWHALHTLGRIGKGDSVLVLGAAGGVGMLAIQLAKLAGAATVVAGVSSESKNSKVSELGADHVINSRGDDLASAIMDATRDHGVDVVVDNIGGSAFDQAVEAARPLARLVSVGKASGDAPTPYDPRALSRRNLVVSGMYLGTFPPGLLRESMAELVALLAAGELRVDDGGRYAFDKADEAVNALRTRSGGGKIVVTVP
ncbi:zinc-binding dehydrogenase [Gordonia sp. HNM0687]|uniref:Zinc-binding dehydrogenase n=1 Tax=Gordonia mangrovi TaxID=2665643 RepID=A0A6L7GV69_9ACTN|nr:zinc-binding dehydrogenase [Gordonia mangrovi]MXP23866.1 zinc-binding dehydrogenase [Gordonia mangrovi]UVF76421.1 zinc-binding dehydrogenase [Gordonia mangrovi]